MKVRYSRRAFADRDAIFSYLFERNTEAARRVVGLISRRIEELEQTPYKGSKTDKPGIYAMWVAPFPYRIFYRPNQDEVLILHIHHTSRQFLQGG